MNIYGKKGKTMKAVGSLISKLQLFFIELLRYSQLSV